MRKSTFIFFILGCLTAKAQINLDSLRQNIENSTMWTKTITVDYLMQPFQRFERIDKLESFDLFIDSTGHLNECIGLTAIYKQFDNQNRLTKRIGYNLKGNYFLWDFSPIEMTEYYNDTTIVAYYNYEFILTSKEVNIKDSIGRLYEELWFDNNNKLYSRTTYKYIDQQNELLITTFDGNDKIKYDKFGVGIRLQKFDTMKRIVEERYFDSQMNLVEAEHDLPSSSNFFNCNFSIVKREYKDNVVLTQYYNSKNELQCESDGFTISKLMIK
jgi:hypothetical protein